MSSHADVKHMAMDEFTRAESAAMTIRMALSQKPQLGAPEVAVVLGSGLGGFAGAGGRGMTRNHRRYRATHRPRTASPWPCARA